MEGEITMLNTGIGDLDKKLKELENDEGWETSGDQLSFDHFFPDFEKDIGNTLTALFLELRKGLKSQASGKSFDAFVFIDTSKTIVAIKNYSVIYKGLEGIKRGDGVKIKYLGKQEPKKAGGNAYHNFEISIKKFEPDAPKPELKKDSDVDDSEALAMIESYQNEFKKEHVNRTPSAQELKTMMETDPDMAGDDSSIARFLKQLHVMVQDNRIKDI
jgi:hypothetical protein